MGFPLEWLLDGVASTSLDSKKDDMQEEEEDERWEGEKREFLQIIALAGKLAPFPLVDAEC